MTAALRRDGRTRRCSFPRIRRPLHRALCGWRSRCSPPRPVRARKPIPPNNAYTTSLLVARCAPKRGYVVASGVPGVAPVLLRFSRYCRAGSAFGAWRRNGCAPPMVLVRRCRAAVGYSSCRSIGARILSDVIDHSDSTTNFWGRISCAYDAKCSVQGKLYSGAPALTATNPARALLTVSSYSFSGTLASTRPAPA